MSVTKVPLWGKEQSRHRVVVPGYRPPAYVAWLGFQTRFLESIPRPIAGLKFSTQTQIDLGMWSRIRINVGKKGPQKSEEMHCLQVLDVLFRGLEASPLEWRF